VKAAAMHNPCATRESVKAVRSGEVRGVRQQRGRDRKRDEADQNSAALIDRAAEIADHQSRYRHAHGARIHGKAHCRRRYAVMLGERGKDGLCCEEIDDGKEGGESDDDESQDGTVRRRVRFLTNGFGGGFVHGGASRRKKRT